MGIEEFLEDLEIAKERFPFIEYEHKKGKRYPYKITDDFEITDDDGNHWGTFRASVYFPSTYPKGMPIMQDESKTFPWNVDWHMSPDDGQCCVCGVIEHEETAKKGISIVGFIKKYVQPFYANQIYRHKYGDYKNGEYSHYGQGVWEALEEEFKTSDRDKILSFIVKLSEKRGRNDVCYCGSGNKYKKCHLPRVNIIKEVSKHISLDYMKILKGDL